MKRQFTIAGLLLVIVSTLFGCDLFKDCATLKREGKVNCAKDNNDVCCDGHATGTGSPTVTAKHVWAITHVCADKNHPQGNGLTVSVLGESTEGCYEARMDYEKKTVTDPCYRSNNETWDGYYTLKTQTYTLEGRCNP